MAATTTPLDAAKSLLARGFVVFPSDHPGQRKCIGAHKTVPCDGERGKHPAVAWGTWRVVTEKMLENNWSRRGGLANPAVNCGPSNLVVFDEDQAGEIRRWCVTYGVELPEDTYTVFTGKGRHLYYRWDHSVERIGNCDKAVDGFTMDIRGDGGNVLGEGAQHASGAVYTGNNLEVAPLPREVAEKLLAIQNRNRKPVADSPGSVNQNTDSPRSEWEAFTATADPNAAMIPMHKRHKGLVAYAGRLRAKGLDYTEAEPVYRQRWLLCEQPTGQIPEAKFHSPDCPYPVTWEEAEEKLADVYDRYPAGNPEAEDDQAAAPTGGQTEVDPLDGAIAHQMTMLRVKREAARRLDAEERPALDLPPVKSLTALLAEPDEDTPWLIDKVMQADSRVMLAAQFKAGKTTIVGNLVRAVADRTPFLGAFDVKQPPSRVVLIDDELSERMLRRWLREQGIENTGAVADVVSLRGRVGTFNLLDEPTRAEWAARLRDLGCDFLILDCLRPILDALGLDENRDAGKFLTAFDAMLADAGIPAAVTVDHMGHNGERNRGDSRKLDWPDATWKLVRENEQPDSPRFFSAYGRDVDVFEGRLGFDPATRRLTYVAGSRADNKVRAAYIDVVRLLAAVAQADPAVARSENPQCFSKAAIEGELRNAGYGENTDNGGHSQKSVRSAIDLGVRSGVLRVFPGPRKAKLICIAHPCVECGMPVASGGDRHESCPADVEGALP